VWCGYADARLAHTKSGDNVNTQITLNPTLAPQLAEAIEESAKRQGISFNDWIVAAAELKLRADIEAAAFEEAERKRRAAGLQEYLDEYWAEFGAPTEEEMAEAAEQWQDGRARILTSKPEKMRRLVEAAGIDAVVIGC
jgi:hypothetical protein